MRGVFGRPQGQRHLFISCGCATKGMGWALFQQHCLKQRPQAHLRHNRQQAAWPCHSSSLFQQGHLTKRPKKIEPVLLSRVDQISTQFGTGPFHNVPSVVVVAAALCACTGPEGQSERQQDPADCGEYAQLTTKRAANRMLASMHLQPGRGGDERHSVLADLVPSRPGVVIFCLYAG